MAIPYIFFDEKSFGESSSIKIGITGYRSEASPNESIEGLGEGYGRWSC